VAGLPITRNTGIDASLLDLVNFETAPASARSSAGLVRHLFSGEGASLRPEVQIVAYGLHSQHAARHGKRLLDLYF
jgi:hypothetical protein